MTMTSRSMYNETVDMLQNLTDQQLSAVYILVAGLIDKKKAWESPLGIETEDQLWSHIDHSIAQIAEGKVAPAKQASQRLRAEYNL
ncbi:MAG: hypothetical protein IJ683_07545 [Butyrivibrio sp.]|nr:hypothetical protein [Butyrivibrio sp.]MBR1642159.1 hypothetical protein [Butyrivibrio sp.]